MSINRRKSDHLRISLHEPVNSAEITTGLEEFYFVHNALPETSLAEVDTSTRFLSHELGAPLLISPMTGGTEEAEHINRNLAYAAQRYRLAMGVGSQRAAIEDPRWARTYYVRDVAPDILLFANLGAVQLNYGYGIEECRRAVDMIEADALVLHLNPLQEALQPEGDTDFSGLLRRIELICRELEVPVIVKEVGWGISEDVARRLAEVGVAAIDVAGAGGTSWSLVEMHRAPDEIRRAVAAAFSDWGIPTAEAIAMARRGAPDTPIIASGGIRTGVDVAKAIALGADLVGMAAPFLKPAAQSAEAVCAKVEEILLALRIAMFCVGARDVAEMQKTRLVRRG